jgi:hypothetical protein
MFKVEIWNGGGHKWQCGWCGDSDWVDGPFILGIQTPASAQETIQAHYFESRVFPSHRRCKAAVSWPQTGDWMVADRAGRALASGTFQMTKDGPVVDPAIDGKLNGVNWDMRRVDELAKMEIAVSKYPQRTWNTGTNSASDIVVNLKRKDGKYEPVVVTLADIHVTKANDESIGMKIRGCLLALSAAGL